MKYIGLPDSSQLTMCTVLVVPTGPELQFSGFPRGQTGGARQRTARHLTVPPVGANILPGFKIRVFERETHEWGSQCGRHTFR